MATFKLLNTTYVGTVKHFPGELIDDNQIDVTALQNAGGVLWPSGNVTVDAAAARAQQMRMAGRNEVEMESVMQSAVQSVQRTEDAASDAENAIDAAATAGNALAVGARIRTLTLAVTQAQIAAKGVVASGTFDSATAFPAGARLLGVESSVDTKVQNAGDTDTTTYKVGTDAAGKSAIGVAAGTDAKTVALAGGDIGAGRAVGGEKLRLTLTTDTTLSLLTAGALSVTASYSVPAAS